MSILTKRGRGRYEVLTPKWIMNFLPEEVGVEDSKELYDEVKKVLEEQMLNQEKECTAFGFILEDDETDGVSEGFNSFTEVHNYSHEKLLKKFESYITKYKITAVRMVFEPLYSCDDLTWSIIVCNN